MAEPSTSDAAPADEPVVATTAHQGRRDPTERDESARDAAAEGADPPRFAAAEPGRLVDQLPLLDEDGEDRRQYTGEPVETDEGWVLPMQQNTGPGTTADGWAGPAPDGETSAAAGPDSSSGPAPDGETSGGDTGDDPAAAQARRARRPADVAGGEAGATPDPAG
ncbi:MAG: hypothetical protein U0Q07_13200 [Acidimicrobiales bacterium]